MKKYMVWMAVVMLLVVTLGCLGSSGSSGGTSSGSGNVTLTVQNQSSEDICFLYVSPTSDDTWGDDRLGSEILNAGDSFDVSIPKGDYDLRAEFCGSTDPVEEYGVSINADKNWTINN